VKVGSLFSGIGGIDLGLERAGMTVAWQSEIDPYASRVLAKHWPQVPNLGDITQIDWSSVEPVDLICGGYPCQPFSLAGVRRGESDPRHLWPHFHNAIRHLRPRHALLENVPGHLSLGFGRVLGDLAEIGYDVEWASIPAAAVGAPHLRYRIFAVAHPAGDTWRFRDGDGATDVPDTNVVAGERLDTDPGDGGTVPPQEPIRVVHQGGGGPDMAGPDTEREGLEGQPRTSLGLSLTTEGGQTGRGQWAVEPDVGRVAHGIPHRVDRLRCLGNAVVPQVAQWIGEQIMKAAA
jgi:DNA (cytosine-5)-methyltransferase 1